MEHVHEHLHCACAEPGHYIIVGEEDGTFFLTLHWYTRLGIWGRLKLALKTLFCNEPTWAEVYLDQAERIDLLAKLARGIPREEYFNSR